MSMMFQNKPFYSNKEECERCRRIFDLENDLDFHNERLVCTECEREINEMD